MTAIHEATAIREAQESVWKALSGAPVRRALLGRERCDALVAVAIDSIPSHELSSAGRGTDGEATARRLMERRIRIRYRENCGWAFTTLVLYWAISAIVQALVARWWNSREAAR